MWGLIVVTPQLDTVTLGHPKGVSEKAHINKWKVTETKT